MNNGLIEAALQPRIVGDTDRDGSISSCDEERKHLWTPSRGLVLLPNTADALKRCPSEDLDGNPLSNNELASCHDASGHLLLSPELASPLKALHLNVSDAAQGHVYPEPEAAARRVRIFARNQSFDERLPQGWTLLDKDITFNATSLRRGIELRVDAREYITDPSVWDGHVNIRFDITDGSVTESDFVAARVAPVLLHHHLQSPEGVLSTAGGAASSPWQARFVDDLEEVLAGGDAGLKLTLFNQSDDIWAQDFLEPAYARMPGPGGRPAAVRVLLRSAQSTRAAGRQIFEQLRGPGLAGFQPSEGSGFGFEEINSGGNLETMPPYVSKTGVAYPNGRAVMGKHFGQYPAESMVRFIDAQGAQGPVLFLEAGWLVVGHVDEMVQFVRYDNDLGWTIAIADTAATLEVLKKAQSEGHGEAKVISYNGEAEPDEGTLFLDPSVFNMTIDTLLRDEELLDTNAYAQKHLDSNLEILLQETGIDRADVLRVPTLFKDFTYPWPETPDGHPSRLSQALPGERLLKSFFPQSINGLVLGGEYIAPKTWGPVVDGRDILEEAVKEAYALANMSITFIDDYMSHHVRGGEVHCGTNTLREMEAWW
ncbi:hypothetical protein EDB81DRAFT_703884 [Dactylonectria macrodidyma]|uniref:Protein-arginine deiminase C-terminal domain-containing protein n=1 Tax=Dactylonectria macrodidyma TaxID=307937 RepID=A0A9P9I7W7_9HYPO|nr:hypothetical protein EDB81DRAFT_703884 [Dactylonectria macrodidyma]